MSTETITPAERAKQIRERLDELAPYPARSEDATAAGLARHLAVRAQVIHVRQLHPDGTLDRGQVDLLTILFAAACALAAVEESDPHSGETAQEIWNAWEDGMGIGDWLWAYLGDDEVAEEVTALAEELLTLEEPRPHDH